MVDDSRIADFIRRAIETRLKAARVMAATCLEMASSAKTADSRAKFAVQAIKWQAKVENITAELTARSNT